MKWCACQSISIDSEVEIQTPSASPRHANTGNSTVQENTTQAKEENKILGFDMLHDDLLQGGEDSHIFQNHGRIDGSPASTIISSHSSTTSKNLSAISSQTESEKELSLPPVASLPNDVALRLKRIEDLLMKVLNQVSNNSINNDHNDFTTKNSTSNISNTAATNTFTFPLWNEAEHEAVNRALQYSRDRLKYNLQKSQKTLRKQYLASSTKPISTYIPRSDTMRRWLIQHTIQEAPKEAIQFYESEKKRREERRSYASERKKQQMNSLFEASDQRHKSFCAMLDSLHSIP